MVFDQSDVTDLAERLRVEYGLDQEPTNLSPADLVEWRRQTKELKEQVVFLFRGWTQQTGLVTLDDLKPSSRSVKDWVAAVLRRKRGG